MCVNNKLLVRAYLTDAFYGSLKMLKADSCSVLGWSRMDGKYAERSSKPSGARNSQHSTFVRKMTCTDHGRLPCQTELLRPGRDVCGHVFTWACEFTGHLMRAFDCLTWHRYGLVHGQIDVTVVSLCTHGNRADR